MIQCKIKCNLILHWIIGDADLPPNNMWGLRPKKVENPSCKAIKLIPTWTQLVHFIGHKWISIGRGSKWTELRIGTIVSKVSKTQFVSIWDQDISLHFLLHQHVEHINQKISYLRRSIRVILTFWHLISVICRRWPTKHEKWQDKQDNKLITWGCAGFRPGP